jgi:hypothetical protein
LLLLLLQEGVVLPQHARGQRLTMDAGGFKFRPLPPHPDRPSVQRMEVTVLVSIDASRCASLLLLLLCHWSSKFWQGCCCCSCSCTHWQVLRHHQLCLFSRSAAQALYQS